MTTNQRDESPMPKRLQRKRTKGSRLPEGCVCVTRPGKWGNPFKPGTVHPWNGRIIKDAQDAVTTFYFWLTQMKKGQQRAAEAKAELRGKDLACWCKLCPKHKDGLPLGEKCAECKPCHADPLLIEANK
jgi:hypothetical protein